MKFKVGDKVRVLVRNSDPFSGQEGVVFFIEDPFYPFECCETYHVKFGEKPKHSVRLYPPQALELVDEREKLDFNTYQELARKTANMGLCSFDRKINWCLGLAGEVGEFVDMIKKALYHGHTLDVQKVVKELGDVLWYIANAAAEYNINLLDVAETNLRKVYERYPEGFSKKDSIERVDEEVMHYTY